MADELYTLENFQQTSTDPIMKAIINIFRKKAPVLDLFRIKDVGMLTQEAIRTKSLPDVHTREIGEGYTASLAKFEPFSEKVSFLGSKIDIPKEYLKVKNSLVDQASVQIQAHATSLSAKANHQIVAGNPLTDRKSMKGMRYRLINEISSNQTIAGGGLDVSSDASGLSANLDTLMDMVDELISQTADGQCSALLMNKKMKQRFTAAARQNNMFASTKDTMGRIVERYGEDGPRLIDIGRIRPDVVTDIILNTETDSGAAETGGDATSIYSFFSDNSEQYLNLWDFVPMSLTEIGLLEDGVSHRWVYDWSMGMFFADETCLARLVGIVAK